MEQPRSQGLLSSCPRSESLGTRLWMKTSHTWTKTETSVLLITLECLSPLPPPVRVSYRFFVRAIQYSGFSSFSFQYDYQREPSLYSTFSVRKIQCTRILIKESGCGSPQFRGSLTRMHCSSKYYRAFSILSQLLIFLWKKLSHYHSLVNMRVAVKLIIFAAILQTGK